MKARIFDQCVHILNVIFKTLYACIHGTCKILIPYMVNMPKRYVPGQFLTLIQKREFVSYFEAVAFGLHTGGAAVRTLDSQ